MSASRTPYVLPVAPPTSKQTVASRSQRCHWYAYDVGVFVHVPGSAVSCWPTAVSPVMVGRVWFRGAPLVGPTTAVCADRAFAAPSAFTAVTRTRSVCPRSAATTRYVLAVAPGTPTQLSPVVPQRSHWYWYA